MKKYIKKFLYLAVIAATFSAHAGSFEDFFRSVRVRDFSRGSFVILLCIHRDKGDLSATLLRPVLALLVAHEILE